MVDGMQPILVSMAAILGIALVPVLVVAFRALRAHEGTPRERMHRRAEQRRAHAAGKPVLFLDASRRQRLATDGAHRDEKRAS